MTSENISYEKLTCDRCGASEAIHDTRHSATWASISVQNREGSSVLSHGYKADMCSTCTFAFGQWWRTK